MTCRVERLYDDADDRECSRCGECCMVLILVRMTRDEAEKLGMEFCFEDKPGEWGIKRVPREWAPKFADEGVCVFLNNGPDGYTCMARDDRPSLCRNFRCVSTRWAAQMDHKVLLDKYRVDYEKLTDDEGWKRWDEVVKAREEKDRHLEFLQEIRQRREGIRTCAV